MSSKKVRLLSVDIFNREPFVYVINKPRPITIDGKRTERTITNIEEHEAFYRIYISNGTVAQEWKDIPKNDKLTVEYCID